TPVRPFGVASLQAVVANRSICTAHASRTGHLASARTTSPKPPKDAPSRNSRHSHHATAVKAINRACLHGPQRLPTFSGSRSVPACLVHTDHGFAAVHGKNVWQLETPQNTAERTRNALKT